MSMFVPLDIASFQEKKKSLLFFKIFYFKTFTKIYIKIITSVMIFFAVTIKKGLAIFRKLKILDFTGDQV